MRTLLAFVVALGCGPAVGASPYAEPVTVADAGADVVDVPPAPVACMHSQGIGMLCDGGCDIRSCGRCGVFCTEGRSCCMAALPGRPDYCCVPR